MARKYLSTLNASTIDILNTIRANASPEYRASIPEIGKAKEIPHVGEIIEGFPAFANEFIGSIINEIALKLIKSGNARNYLAPLKKGSISFGDSIEEMFVGMTKAREFSPEKAEAREFKRYLPEVKSAFHTVNWKAIYPITVQRSEIYKAFKTEDGVLDLINKIVGSVIEGQNYDEYLLTKYLLLKAVSKGHCKYVGVDGSSFTDMASKFRAYSNRMTFVSSEFNNRGVHTSTSKDDQFIILDAGYAGEYDVNVLASAFNRDAVDFESNRLMVDSFDTFDNDRFTDYRAECDGLEEVTSAELALTKDVKAMLIDKEFVQMYDSFYELTETPVHSGRYVNYFLNVDKVVSWSPFSQAIAFVKSASVPANPNTLTARIVETSRNDNVLTVTVDTGKDGAKFEYSAETEVSNGIAIHEFGGYMLPISSGSVVSPSGIRVVYNGDVYTGNWFANTNLNTTVTLTKQ